MRLTGINKLQKLKAKNLGNKALCTEIDKLISTIEAANWKDSKDIKLNRKDADCIYDDKFFFFDIHIHRALVLLVFDYGVATVIWIGSHKEYQRTFKNNKKSIEKWLRINNYIE